MSLSQYPVVVMGDLHGRADLLRRALTAFGLADTSGRWTGGTRRLVQLGDLIDRGREPLATLDLLMRLQEDAAAAGGEVLCLMGNHEAMALRAGAGCHAGRLQWALNGGGTAHAEWLAQTGQEGDLESLPYPEPFYHLFGPEGRYGRWFRTHRMAVRVGPYVAVHAGWTPDGPESVEAADCMLADPTLDLLAAATQADHPLGNWNPLTWARRQPDEEVIAACRRLTCRGLIAGHTPQEGIRVSAGGHLVQIDVGLFYRQAWAAVALDDEGRLWGVVEGAEPQRLDGDGLLPMPALPADHQAQPDAARFGPGDLVQLSRVADWAQFFAVDGMEEREGYLFYIGRWLTLSGGEWSAVQRTRPTFWIDRFGRLANRSVLPPGLNPAAEPRPPERKGD